MAEYIEREAVIKKFKERCTKCDARFEDPLCLQCSGRSDLETVCDLPAADVAPVVHGRWDGNDCTVCKLPWNYNMTQDADDWGYFDPMPDYCPNCGARMDGGVRECD